MRRGNRIWALIYGLLLTAFTVYLALDTFVITRIYSVVPESSETASSESAAQDGAESSGAEASESEQQGEEASQSDGGSEYFTDGAVVTDSLYSDGNISILLTEYREYGTSIYVADIRVSSAEYLKTALAQSAYGLNVTEKTSAMAEDSGAILAVNGDYYGAQRSGYVIRNGKLYRETASNGSEDLVIWADGSFSVITEGEISASELLEQGARQVLSFGPALVLDGQISVTEADEVGKAKASNPRTAVGVIDGLHYVFVVSDGRTDESEGLSLLQLAEFMESLGVTTGYNLDGGGSSTMYFNGAVVNNPTTGGGTIKERSVSDIVYIGY